MGVNSRPHLVWNKTLLLPHAGLFQALQGCRKGALSPGTQARLGCGGGDGQGGPDWGAPQPHPLIRVMLSTAWVSSSLSPEVGTGHPGVSRLV